ncbi:hypothetical protein MIND_00094200 [Mycena indigotica]|uniref:DUF6534 domain-containing protein n=1 Tax=Mycena indigotica TaxID=2126181 RepID=A0A8H6WFG8_9AGAR|nr:uncharacterized protein MIND_00094200 [Mycena indigotica]KAF7315782.1 hypothetical protein MIND_00094200 [Mycena indigotica]
MAPPPPIVVYVLGGWDLGICGDLLLQGVIFAQISHYFSLYHSDVPALRMFVLGLLLLTTLKSMQMIAVMWVQNVVYFTKIAPAARMFLAHWTEQISLGLGACVHFYVQLFLVHRLWVLSKNLYIVATLLVVFSFAWVASLVAMVFSFHNVDSPLRGIWISIHIGIVFGGDVLLCFSTAYFLLKHSKQVLPQTAGMLNAILRLTFQSAAPGAVCAMMNLITSRTSVNPSNPFNVSLMLSIITTDILPKIYAVSAMYTLNSRRAIRLAGSSGHDTSSNEGPSGGRRTGPSGGRGVELGTFGGVQRIQVRTQVQTTHHTDEDGVMFGQDDTDRKARGMEEASLETDKRGLR